MLLYYCVTVRQGGQSSHSQKSGMGQALVRLVTISLIRQIVQLDKWSDRYIINNLINWLTNSFNQVNNTK